MKLYKPRIKMRISDIRHHITTEEIEATFDLYMVVAELNRIEAVEPEEYSKKVRNMVSEAISTVRDIYEQHCTDLFKSTGINAVRLIEESSEYYNDYEGFERAILSLSKH